MVKTPQTSDVAYFMLCLALFLLILSIFSFKDGLDPLEARCFNISLSETRNGVVAKKVIMDKIEFKNGKLRISYIQKKYMFKWIKYRILKDSIFTDSTNTQVRQLELSAIATDNLNQTIYLDFVTCEWDLDGSIKITKNDRLKHYYDVAGREKGGKPKKHRRRTRLPNL